MYGYVVRMCLDGCVDMKCVCVWMDVWIWLNNSVDNECYECAILTLFRCIAGTMIGGEGSFVAVFTLVCMCVCV